MQMSTTVKRRLENSSWEAHCPRVKQCPFHCPFKKRAQKMLTPEAIVACVFNPAVEFVIQQTGGKNERT